ncbi:hypothetical protein CWM66_28400, partial [Kosakonia sp. H7A]
AAPLKLGDILQMQTGLPSTALDANLQLFQLLQAVIQLSNSNSAVAASVISADGKKMPASGDHIHSGTAASSNATTISRTRTLSGRVACGVVNAMAIGTSSR